MTIAHAGLERCLLLDPAAGLAGDMFVGMLVDLGVDTAALRPILDSLDLPSWSMEVTQEMRREVGATKVTFLVPEERDHRHLPEIERRIEASTMSARAKRWALTAFRTLARAEAAVHKVPIDHVHFHEVGAADAILDICASCIGLDMLEVERLICAPLPGGSGVTRCAHGELPVPVPAVLEMVADRFELVLGQGEGEMVTPTGMSLVAGLGEPTPRGLRVVTQRVGYGAGTRASSVLRGVLGVLPGTGSVTGDGSAPEDSIREEEIVVLHANVDDLTGEHLAFAMRALMDAGALDVSAAPITMKKGRPAVQLEVMCAVEDERAMVAEVMSRTRSLGVRAQRTRRWIAVREIVEVECAYGTIAVKVSHLGARAEYEDCAAAATRTGAHLEDIARAAIAAYEAAQDVEGPP